jgi:hypothetical protein
VLATLVRIDRAVKRDIGRTIGADDLSSLHGAQDRLRRLRCFFVRGIGIQFDRSSFESSERR